MRFLSLTLFLYSVQMFSLFQNQGLRNEYEMNLYEIVSHIFMYDKLSALLKLGCFFLLSLKANGNALKKQQAGFELQKINDNAFLNVKLYYIVNYV